MSGAMTRFEVESDALRAIRAGLQQLMESHGQETPESVSIWIRELVRYQLDVFDVPAAKVAEHLQTLADAAMLSTKYREVRRG